MWPLSRGQAVHRRDAHHLPSRGAGDAVARALLFRARAGGPASRSGREPVTPCARRVRILRGRRCWRGGS